MLQDIILADRKNLHILVDSMKWILVELDVAIKDCLNTQQTFQIEKKDKYVSKCIYQCLCIRPTQVLESYYTHAGVRFLRNEW